MVTRVFRCSLFVLILAAACAAQEEIRIDANATATPFPHFWEQMFGSGRAILSLRDQIHDGLWPTVRARL